MELINHIDPRSKINYKILGVSRSILNGYFFENNVLAPIFKLSVFLHRRKIFNNKIIKLSLPSNLNICRLNSENPSLSFRLLRQKPLSAKAGSRFVAIKILIYSCYWTLRYAVWISKIVPLVLKLFAKYLFLANRK